MATRASTSAYQYLILTIALLLISASTSADEKRSPTPPPPVTTPALAADLDTREGRWAFLLEGERRHPFPAPEKVDGSIVPIGALNLAYALFSSPALEDHDKANSYVAKLASYYNAAALPPSKTMTRTENFQNFHFQPAQFFYRIYKTFGYSTGPLTDKNSRSIADIFAAWGHSNCRLAETNPERLSFIWGSENHQLQHNTACWVAADVLRGDARYKNEMYEDGSSPQAQQKAWTKFTAAMLNDRARNGGLIEYFSPTYAAYSLTNLSIFIDFSDNWILRMTAERFLDLWWALWAQEQRFGIHGGSRTRAYRNRLLVGTPLSASVWTYWRLGPPPAGLPFGETMLLASTYHPPLFVDTMLRGNFEHLPSYEVYTRALGLATTSREVTAEGISYHLDRARFGVLRIAKVTDDFILSTAILPLLSDDAWMAISSQNRFGGLLFTGDDPTARIIPSVMIPSDQKSYNSVFSVQSGSTQMVRGVFSEGFPGPHRMGTFFGPKLRRFEQGDWIFVEATGYAGVRPAFGGWRETPDAPGWMELNDPRSPVIIQAARKGQFPNLSSFISAVVGLSMEVDSSRVSFTGLDDAGRLTLGLDGDTTLEINGHPIDFHSGYVLKSPFINQAAGSSVVHIKTPDGMVDLDFSGN